ncbi:DNA primase [uncultured Desulfobacter sp.]|uniref:DNA primase n=1 Tax=uncultured Desulfobacter sp. TaxID=240139 RepID=UPI0029F48057|nr:DNA primase [uncultured Desulfobacter sp.]
MMIPEEKIAEILAVSDIFDIVSEAVILKKSGRNFFGLCPFHSEKTPSFSVNPDKQIFHCFGCGVGGNVLSFVMKYHGISFPEAVKMLARKYNIVVETRKMSPEQRKAVHTRESLFRLNKKVMQAYTKFLNDPTKGRSAKQYLERRGTSQQIIEQFQLGYASDAWDAIVNLLRKEKVAKGVAVGSGLVLEKKQKNGFYDRFRNRLMFPIFDINMQVAGFGGRVMDDSMPKYMNSPESPVYSKSRILYGLHAAKQACRRQGKVFIVEGYFDFLSLYQHGIENSVATLGTALTREHVRVLKGYATTMVLVFDSDEAGIKAAKRSVGIFVQEGIDTRILVLPGNNDPDSYVMAHGRDAFLELADTAKTVMQFLLQLALDTYGTTVEGRIKVLDEMKQHLALIQDYAVRSIYVRELSETLNIDEKAVLEKVKDAYDKQASRKTRGSLMPDEVGDNSKNVLESDPREKQILSMMLQWPELICIAVEKKVVPCFYSTQLKKLGCLIIDIGMDTQNIVSEAMARVETDEDRQLIASMAMEDYTGVQDPAQTFAVLVNRVIKIKNKTDRAIVSELTKVKEGCGVDVIELLKRKQQQINQLHNS